MPNASEIAWTDEVMNSLFGCAQNASKGCRNCYAVNSIHRHASKQTFNADRRFDPLVAVHPATGDMHFTGIVLFEPRNLYSVLNDLKSKKVFVNEFSDLLFEAVPIELIVEHFKVFAAAPQHIFQILTKRAARLAEVDAAVKKALGGWPSNVCMGVSVCSAHPSEFKRIEQIGATSARVKLISFEPWLSDMQTPLRNLVPNLSDILRKNRIDWSIVGGESGTKDAARLMTLDDAHYLMDSSKAAGCKTFFKQLGTALAINLGVYSTRGKGEHNKAGANPSRWPAGPWLREWPNIVLPTVKPVDDFKPNPAFATIKHYGQPNKLLVSVESISQ